MFRSGFFWKLYASYAALVLLTTAVIGILVHNSTERALVARLEQGLRDNCVLLDPYSREVLGGEQDTEVGGQLSRLSEKSGVRITLIEPDGKVLADSDRDATEMENHIGRPEVRYALEEGFGMARRRSTTLGDWRLYVAHVLWRDGAPLGVVRVSILLDEVDAQLASMRQRIVFGAVIGSLVALALGLFVARRITAPIVQMTETAHALRDGNYDGRVLDLPNNEIGVLGDALNRLGGEIKRRLADLSAEEARLRAMLAGMVEGVLGLDDEDRVMFSNGAARKLLGIADGDIVGRRLWELVRLANLDGLIEQAKGSEVAARSELVFMRDDRELILGVRAHRFTSTDASGVVVVFDDVTDLRRLERIRSDFVANVSHELKTPLTSIRGYVETLLAGAVHDQDNNIRFLRKVDDNVMRLNHLVQDLLSLARIESSTDGVQLDDVDWRRLIVQATQRHEGAARKKRIELQLEAPDGALRVMGDEESLTQVVDNLLDNAIKYTPEDGRVRIVLAQTEEHGVLAVEDTGEGIPHAEQERIFERFYRVDKARSRALGGTGLGLSIVKHLVQAMKGEVRVESEEGKGSSFSVQLPRASA